MKSKNIFVTAILIAASAITLVAVHSCKMNKTYIYETSKVAKGSIVNTVTATGTLEAITSVEVGTQVSGIVDKLYVDFNSHVTKGQILAELDKTSLKSSVEESLASLDNAKAEMAYEASTFERSQALHAKNLIAQADYDEAKYNYEKSKATLKSAQAQYDKSLVQLGYATIFSPIDGVVMNRAVDEGQTVAASFSTPEIFTIAQDLTQMQVEADIDESDIGMVKEGQRVEFDVDAYPDEKFLGTVEQIRLEPVTTSNVVTYTVIINAPNPDQKLLPGMTANIVIYVEETMDILTVPYKAVKFTPATEYLAKMGKKMASGKGMPKGPEGAGVPPASGNAPDMSSMNGGSGNMPSGQGANATMPSATGGANGSGAQGSQPWQMPDGSVMSESSQTKSNVWVKDDKGIRPVPVELGSSDGDNIEVKSGLNEGDEVVIKMTAATAKEKKEHEASSSPFMPGPPGRNNSKSSNSESKSSSRK